MWLHEALCRDPNNFVSHKKGLILSADMGTKSLNKESFERHATSMGIMEQGTDIQAEKHREHREGADILQEAEEAKQAAKEAKEAKEAHSRPQP